MKLISAFVAALVVITLFGGADDSVGTSFATPSTADPSIVGQWSPVLETPIVTVHATLLTTGEVLVFDKPQGEEYVWNLLTNTFRPVPANAGSLFCSAHSALPDGRILVTGGNYISEANIFDPATELWTQAPNMSYTRFYPTNTALPDGRVLVTAGYLDKSTKAPATTPEVYDPTTNTWTSLTNASLDLQNYPFNFVLPDGKVLVAGSRDEPVATSVLDLNTQTWTTVDGPVDGGSAAMYRPGKIITSGTVGRSISLPPAPSVVATTRVLDMAQSPPAWRQTPSMAFQRTEHNLTLLPDGTVLATGGGGTTDRLAVEQAVHEAESWSPVTETWTTMAPMEVPRLYHSVALLLPDGRVLVSGGGRNGDMGDQLSAEIYSPPYLFKGSRPTITSAPSTIQYGTSFSVDTSAEIAMVSLLRLGSVTHAFDQEQRFVELEFQPVPGGLTVLAPETASLAPTGNYMLFIVDTKGVPSEAVIVRALWDAPAPTVTSVDPTSGPPAGGTAVTITGTGFVDGASVTIGWTAVTSVTFVNDTTIDATTPAHTAGTVDVKVTNPDFQSATLTGGFIYEGVVVDVAGSEVAGAGTLTGSYTDTWTKDGVYEVITERSSRGKKQNRYSYLLHKWVFNVAGGNMVTFAINAHMGDTSADGDAFTFAYSTDDSMYTDMVVVSKTADDGNYQSYSLPSTTAGQVFVQVTDTDRTSGNESQDSIHVNHMFISSGTPADSGTDLSLGKGVDNGTPNEGDTITYTVMVSNLGPDGATGVQVDDLLPAGVSFVSAVPTGSTSYVADTGVWDVGSLGDMANETLTITATVNSGTAGTTITNSAEVAASDQFDPDTLNNSASVDIMVAVVGSGTGTVQGRVEKISGARVTVDSTGQFDLTNNGGRYSIANVPAVTQDITASSGGCTSQTVTVVVIADQNVKQDFVLVCP